MRVDALAQATSSRLIGLAATDTIQTAALAFADIRIGLIVIRDERGRARGVLSKFDLVRHLASEGEMAAPLAGAMSRDIVHCAPHDDLYGAWQSMLAHGVRNMPVLDADARPVGVLDIRDALQALLGEEEHQEALLFDYIASAGYH